MSMQRHVPITLDQGRWYPAEFDNFFRDPTWSSFREPLIRDSQPRDLPRDPQSRDLLRDLRDWRDLRDPYRDVPRESAVPVVYQPPSSSSSSSSLLPLSRSFFNPERQLSHLDPDMQRMTSEMRRMFQEMQHLMPADANPESWRKKENYLLDNPVYLDQHTGREQFRLQFDVRQFKPEEICVKTSGNSLTVHARHEEKSEGKSLLREYHRQYVIPTDLNPENLVSKLSRDGVLTIEAPLPINEGNKLIPIKHE